MHKHTQEFSNFILNPLKALYGITIIHSTKYRRSVQHQQEAWSTVTGAKGVLEVQARKENFETTKPDGSRKQRISTCEMQTESKNSVAAGNGDRRRGDREESWKTVREQDHDKVSFSHAGSCL